MQQQEMNDGAQDDSLLQIYFKKDDKSFSLYSNKFKNLHTSTINDVAWAPLVGRSYHMIASCSRDMIIVWKVTVRDIFNPEMIIYKEPLIEAVFRTDQVSPDLGQIWRLSWNLLGTCFASSSEDGSVRIWKKSVKGFS